jgi:hypothetical protein
LVTNFYDRQISCLVTDQNFSGVDAGLMKGVGHGGAITYQAACRRVFAS